MDAADAAAPRRHVGQELVARRAGRRRPRRADTPQRVRVAAADDDLAAGERQRRRQPVVFREHGAVARLDGRRRVDQQLEVALERQLPLVEVERVVEGEEDAGRAQVGGDLEGVAAQRLQLAMRGLRHPPRAEVDLDTLVGAGRAVDRQPARDLFAEDHVAIIWRSTQQLEPAVDAVVIGDGDQVHAARLGCLVDGQRVGEAVAALEEREIVVVAGMPGMDVEIGPEHGSIVPGPVARKQPESDQWVAAAGFASKPALSVPLAFATVSSSG